MFYQIMAPFQYSKIKFTFNFFWGKKTPTKEDLGRCGKILFE